MRSRPCRQLFPLLLILSVFLVPGNLHLTYVKNGSPHLVYTTFVMAADDYLFPVSMKGNIIVFAPEKSTVDGCTRKATVFVLRYNGTSWIEEARLSPSNGGDSNCFGRSISVDRDRVAVGVNGNDFNVVESGAVYVFRYNGKTWEEEARLVPDDVQAYDHFGQSVSIADETIVVGADNDNQASPESGSAYIFEHNGKSWREAARLVPDDLTAADHFGSIVSISGDTIAIGAEGDDDAGPESGAVYIYRHDGSSWLEEDKITPNDVGGTPHFGSMVSVAGETILVWDGDSIINSIESSPYYIFRYDGSFWTEGNVTNVLQKLQIIDAHRKWPIKTVDDLMLLLGYSLLEGTESSLTIRPGQ